MIGYRIKVDYIHAQWIVEEVEIPEDGFPIDFKYFPTELEAWKDVQKMQIMDIKNLDKTIKKCIKRLEEIEDIIKSLEP